MSGMGSTGPKGRPRMPHENSAPRSWRPLNSALALRVSALFVACSGGGMRVQSSFQSVNPSEQQKERHDKHQGYGTPERAKRPRNPCEPPQPLADWVGVIGTGQSLSIGAAAGTPISTTQPFNNLKLHDDGPDPRYPLDGSGDLSLVPLTELFRPTSLPGWP